MGNKMSKRNKYFILILIVMVSAGGVFWWRAHRQIGADTNAFVPFDQTIKLFGTINYPSQTGFGAGQPVSNMLISAGSFGTTTNSKGEYFIRTTKEAYYTTDQKIKMSVPITFFDLNAQKEYRPKDSWEQAVMTIPKELLLTNATWVRSSGTSLRPDFSYKRDFIVVPAD